MSLVSLSKQARRLESHPDRFLPADKATRAVAQQLYQRVSSLPIVSPHGHVDLHTLVKDEPFSDPATLFVTSDHYVTRLLHAAGVGYDQLFVDDDKRSEAVTRKQWHVLCDHWSVIRGSVVQLWLESQLADIFGVELVPAPETADTIYDQLTERLAADECRPRALYRRFGIEVLTTTDDPASDLSAHTALAADPSWTGRVIPAFRPDRYLEPDHCGWADAVHALGVAADVDIGGYDGFVAALETRRQTFRHLGATTTDHAHLDARAEPLDRSEALRIYRAAQSGDISRDEAAAFRRHMIFEMARMSCEDGLVMTLHPGVLRDHHGPTARRFGPDRGADIPVQAEFTQALRPMLERFGTYPGFHLVVFTADETTWSRELAPLAGFYPCLYLGAPWWFLDAPEAIRRFRAAVTDIVGYTRTSGFVDDARALCSIPARHDMSRRLEVATLAQRVTEHRLREEEAEEILLDLVTSQPTKVFKLDRGTGDVE